MAIRTSLKLNISQRVDRLRRIVKVDTQQIRAKTLKDLNELFNLAMTLARGEVKTQTEGGKTVRVTLKQRQMWARVAAYVAQIMNSVASGFDERQINRDLDELERMVREARAKAEAGKAEKGSAGTGEDAASREPHQIQQGSPKI